MNKPPPEDLAGYQHVVIGLIEPGDILVGRTVRFKSWAKFSIGMPVEHSGFDVYRKMECPKHEGQAKFNPDDWTYIPDGNPLDKARTSDEGKPPLAMLPWKGLRLVANVQAFGHKKYNDYFNYKKGLEVGRNLSCAIRHIADYMDGNDLDKESGENHLAHAACRLLFALENIQDGTTIDNRYKKP